MAKTTRNKKVQTKKTMSLTKVDKYTKVLKPIVTNKKIQCLLGKCPVCFDELGAAGTIVAYTTCGHVYCLRCLLQALKQRKICPICRGSLPGEEAFQALYMSSHSFCYGDGENEEGPNDDEASTSRY